MATKAKKKVHPMPKLGWKDMLLYWIVMGAFGGFGIAGFFLPLYVTDQIAFSDPGVLAATSGPGNDRFLWLPLLCFAPLLIIGCGPYQKRLPIFGRSDIKYGPPAYPRIYPVFMKNKPQYWVSPKEVKKQKRIRLFIIALLIVAFAICIPLYASSFYGRTVLSSNGSIAIYDPNNEVIEKYYSGEITSVELTTYSTHHRGHVNWYVSFHINIENGESFSFSMTSFPGSSTRQLEAMLYVKEHLFPDRCFITGTEDLEKVIWDRYSQADEKALLYQLFEVSP